MVFFSAQKGSILDKPIHARPDLDRWIRAPKCTLAAAAVVICDLNYLSTCFKQCTWPPF
jgi:hypothetical protein